MEHWWVWGGSVVRADDGLYHMLVSRWPRDLPFFEGYKTHSQIAHAVARVPEGPYEFRGVALPPRGVQYWDGRMTHNPTIHRWRDVFLLFYIGSTYPDEAPGDSYDNIRIGLATAPTPDGPWERRPEPVLDIRPDCWDSTVVTNPAPCVLEDGRILLLYRSNTPDGLRIGAAMADGPDGPFRRISSEPVLSLGADRHVEDPCVRRAGDHFELLAKDMTGAITGEKHAGVHARSADGVDWTLCEPAKAYSRRVRWDDGTVTVQGCVERPKLLIQDGEATHLFCATADGPGGFRRASRTWCMVFPLESAN